MTNIVTIPTLIKTLRPLGVHLRTVALIVVMAFATIGLTFQPCQCDTCACSQAGQSCCCDKTPNCCSDCNGKNSKCDGINSDCGCKGSDDGCSCTFCMCGISVNPTLQSKINDSVPPVAFTTTLSQISPTLSLTVLLWSTRPTVIHPTYLYALHCRWLI